MTIRVDPPYQIYSDVDGSALNDGYLYIGAENDNPETNPVPVYWDAELTIPAAQPIRTTNGYGVNNGNPGNLYTAGAHSLTIRDKNLGLVFYFPTAGANVALVTSPTGSLSLPVGTTAQRDATPVLGMMRYNTTTGALEVYSAEGWSSVPSGNQYVQQTSATGSAKLPVGTTAQRDGTPVIGMLRYNSDSSQFEGYSGTWGGIGGGSGGSQWFFENPIIITTSTAITAGKNAVSAGPITIDTGVTVTVPSGSAWTIV